MAIGHLATLALGWQGAALTRPDHLPVRRPWYLLPQSALKHNAAAEQCPGGPFELILCLTRTQLCCLSSGAVLPVGYQSLHPDDSSSSTAPNKAC